MQGVSSVGRPEVRWRMEGRIGSEELRSWEEAMGTAVEQLGKGDLGDQEKERLRWKQPRDRLIMPGR